MSAYLILLAAVVTGSLLGANLHRLIPKPFPTGTRVTVHWSSNIPGEYLRRSSVGHHKVRVVEPDYWAGRVITVGTDDMTEAAS